MPHREDDLRDKGAPRGVDGRGTPRILLLIKGLGRGGAEQLVVSAVRNANASRFCYEVAYLLPRKDALVGELEAIGVPVHCLQGARGVGWVGRLSALVRDRGIDLVHVHSPYAAVGARLRLASRCPLVYTEHNVWQRYHPATYWANLSTYPRNDFVFAVSEHVRMSVRYPRPLRFLRMPPVETLYHGPDRMDLAARGSTDGVREELGIPEGVPVVGTVANFKPAKGYGYLFRAATEVRRRVPDVRFVLVGQGPLESDLRLEAHELGLDGTVVFAGLREDALRVAETFDVFVLPSIYEGLSIALVEAMAMGRPPVVTSVGGIPEVVEDGRSGLVVPPADSRALADGILALLLDDPLRERVSAEARRRAELFDMEKAVRRIEDVYAELLR